MGDSTNKLSHNKLLLRDAKILLRDFIYKLYINKVYLFLREGKLFLKNSIFSLYINKVNLLLRDAKLLMRDSTYKLGPVRTTRNFVCFAKKSVNAKPFVVRTIFVTHQNFRKCHQTSNTPSTSFGGLQFFVRRANVLFLDRYPSTGHHIS